MRKGRGLGEHRQAGGLCFRVGMGVVQVGLAEDAQRAGDHVQQQLAPNFVTDSCRDVHGDASGTQHIRQCLGAGRDRAIRLTEDQARAALDMDMAGRGDGAGGIDDAGDGTLRTDRVPDRVTWVDAGQPDVIQLAAVAVEVEPGQAVHREHHRGVRPKQRTDSGGDGGERRRLDRDDHRVLLAEVRRVGAGPHRGVDVSVGRVDVQAVTAHRREVVAARHHRHVRAALEQAPGQVPADRTGAVDANPHDRMSTAARERACTPRPMQASSGW